MINKIKNLFGLLGFTISAFFMWASILLIDDREIRKSIVDGMKDAW